MADFNQFGSAKPLQSADAQHCAQCEAMLADALDGTLSAADQATFDLHMVGCSSCASLLADAQRGAAWMEMLKSPCPEPPSALLERILAQTSGQAAGDFNAEAPAYISRTPNTLLGRPTLVPAGTSALQPAAAYTASNVVPFRSRLASSLHFRSIGQTLLQPRLAMTAAMAFFSIALTLNLTGVHLSELRASDLKPSSIMRSCYEAKARVVRYSDNLRVVYELESRVRDLQRGSDTDGSTSTQAPQNNPAVATPSQKPAGDQHPDDQRPASPSSNQKQDRPKPGPGSSRRESPGGGHMLLVDSAHGQGIMPLPPQVFALLTPSVLKHLQEGDLV